MSYRRPATALLAAVLVGSAGLAGHALAQQPSPAEQAITYRKAVYQVILWNLGPMGQVVQGNQPHDAQRFATQARRIATMAPMLAEGYPADSLVPGKTRAKADIWRNMPEFQKLMNDFVQQSESFAKVAEGGDLAKIRPAFGQLTQTCRTCHDRFRAD